MRVGFSSGETRTHGPRLCSFILSNFDFVRKRSYFPSPKSSVCAYTLLAWVRASAKAEQFDFSKIYTVHDPVHKPTIQVMEYSRYPTETRLKAWQNGNIRCKISIVQHQIHLHEVAPKTNFGLSAHASCVGHCCRSPKENFTKSTSAVKQFEVRYCDCRLDSYRMA